MGFRHAAISAGVALHRLWLTGEMTDDYITGAFPELIGKHLVSRRKTMVTLLPTLAGKNLSCWCPLDGPAIRTR